MAALTLTELIKNARYKLNEVAGWNTLEVGDVTNSGTTVTITDGGKWEAGAIGEWQDNGEQFLVLASPVGNDLTVSRAYNGTVATSHVNGTRILRDPVFSMIRIQKEAEATMEALWPNIWSYADTTITPDPKTTKWYALPEDFVDPIRVIQQTTGNVRDYKFYGVRYSPYNIRWEFLGLLDPNPGTSPMIEFPTGFWNLQNTVLVRYRRKVLSTLTSGSYDDIVDADVKQYLYADTAAKLIWLKDIPRVSQQDAAMGDQTIQGGMRSAVGRGLKQEADRLLHQIEKRLWEEIPPMPNRDQVK